MKAIEYYFLAWLDREDAEQRMNDLSDAAIEEVLRVKPNGGRIAIDDAYSIELALVPKYNLHGKKGWQAQLWRGWLFILTRLNKQVSEAISHMRTLGESYAEEHEDYEPELTAVLKIISPKDQKEKEKNQK